MAHMIPLYTRRGIPVEIACSPDKAPLFLAAGATLTSSPKDGHDWPHPPQPDRLTHDDHWNGNKAAFSLNRDPFPEVGSLDRLWREFLDVKIDLGSMVDQETCRSVDAYLEKLQPPFICVHTRGNTAVESKNFNDEEALRLYRALLDRTDGTLILLDWDDRVPRLASYRVRHIGDDWRLLNVLELHRLLSRSALFIGIDSGPLHFARFTDVPAIGIWTHHAPHQFTLPRSRTLNIVPSDSREINKLRRVPFHTVECPTGNRRLDGEFIADQAVRMLAGPRYLPDEFLARDVQIQQWLGWTRAFDGPLSGFIDRHKSFDLALKRLGSVLRPLVVETGCIRASEDWAGAGFSTYLVAAALEKMGGKLHSVDLNGENLRFAANWTRCFGETVTTHEAHSHNWLRDFSGTIDLFYSDSADVGTPGFEESCLVEVQLAAPKVRLETGAILIDDTCWNRGRFHGKGALAIPWLLENGWKILYGGYQALLVRKDDKR